MLQFKNLSIRYESEAVIENLCLEMAPGRVHGLVGLNGSGKTTLLNAMYGILKPYQGAIYWDGQPLHYSKIAYLESSHFFYSRITGLEYLSLFKNKNKGFDLHSWNEIFQLPLNVLVEEYSSGMKKKLALMGILSFEKKEVFLLDEPFNALDLESNELLKNIIRRLKEQGKTLLLTSHILETLTNTCDFIHWLKGRNIPKSYAGEDFPQMQKDIFEEENKEKNAIIERLLAKN